MAGRGSLRMCPIVLKHAPNKYVPPRNTLAARTPRFEFRSSSSVARRRSRLASRIKSARRWDLGFGLQLSAEHFSRISGSSHIWSSMDRSADVKTAERWPTSFRRTPKHFGCTCGIFRRTNGIGCIASVAAMVGNPARANMLFALRDDGQVSAGELAGVAGVSPSTASKHLSHLLAAGLVRVIARGRRRYYSLADSRVAELLYGV